MKTIDYITEWTIKALTALTSCLALFLLLYIIWEGLPLFKTVDWQTFIGTADWNPLGANGHFGILAMITGSMYVSVLALLMALPIGIGSAVYICFCWREDTGKVLLSFIDMLAGVPSVVFGFVGLVVIVKFFEDKLDMPAGECVLAGAILLAIMILPFIVTNCTESLAKGRRRYAQSSLNLGVGRWYTIRKIILPQSLKAVGVSLILAFSRAMGETMAVMMVMGNAATMPQLLHKGETIPALIALEMGSAEYASPHYHALYAAGLVLLVILVVCNLLFYMFKRRLGQ